MTDTTYLIDQYVTTQPGDAIRLFLFGQVVKNGKKRTITADYARRFKLPPWQPPVKLGSHREETPAGGHIVGLEVREDGLYALTETTEKGRAALADGHYRYHSPEVIWDDGAIEDSTTGDLIPGPFIVGTALLHNPHLGNRAALYSVNPLEVTMSEQTVNVPVSWFESMLTKIGLGQQPEPTPPPVVETNEAPGVDADQFAALQAERDQFAARIAAIEAEAARAARVEHFAAELAETPVKDNGDVLAILAGLDDEAAAPLVQQFRALSEQAAQADLTKPVGGTGAGREASPIDAFHAITEQIARDEKMPYQEAVNVAAQREPALYQAAFRSNGK